MYHKSLKNGNILKKLIINETSDFIDNINTFNFKNHQVLKLKFPPIKYWQWIYSSGDPRGPPQTASCWVIQLNKKRP